MKTLSKLVISLLVLSAPVAHASEQRDCAYNYKVTMHNTSGKKHTDVERAGVVLLKDYGKDCKQPNDRYTVILGHDAKEGFYNFFAGKIEKTHMYTSDTAAAELKEETGGKIKLSGKEISGMPYVYHGKKQLFFYRNDTASVREITKACAAACKNKNLPECQREVDKAIEVPLIELLKVAKQAQKTGKKGTYKVNSRCHGVIEIEGFYLRVFAHQYEGVCKIGNKLFGVNIFK